MNDLITQPSTYRNKRTQTEAQINLRINTERKNSQNTLRSNKLTFNNRRIIKKSQHL